MNQLILASASPRRRELFQLAGLDFQVIPSKVEEVITKTEPKDVVMELAKQKAEDVFFSNEKKDTVIGADTIVAFDGKILGKPKDTDDAKKMLSMLSGQTHQVFTGVSIIKENAEKTFYEETKVTFYSLTQNEIDDYVETGEPMDKAGAYGIQGKAAVFVKEIQGDYNNVVGFPIARFMQELKRL